MISIKPKNIHYRERKSNMEKRVLFLNPPSYEGFDGGAGSRYQARREVKSFWYPTWLAQAAALCPGSKLVDAPAHGIGPRQVIKIAKDFDMVVIFTSTPGFKNDILLASDLKNAYPDILIGLVGPHTTALPEDSLKQGTTVDFVAIGEFDYTILEIAQGMPLSEVRGIAYRKGHEIIVNPGREMIQDMDALPSVLDVYKRDLTIENYFIGYLLHPYLSLYTGRGCSGKCTFCLWPQTIAGRRYRKRSVNRVVDEMKRAKEMFPQVKEFFFDDDTFTSDFRRTEEIAKGLGRVGIIWSCSSRANVPEKTLAIMKDNGLRLVMVGVESGSDQILKNIKKGLTTNQIKRFMKTCRKLGIVTHATFVLGLPGETRETIEQTIRFAKEIDPDTIQVSIATPYPGTELYDEALKNGWLVSSELVTDSGIQQAALEYRDLSREDIFNSVEGFYNRFYFRPKPILRIVKTMITDVDMCRRRLREAKEFFQFMRSRKRGRKVKWTW